MRKTLSYLVEQGGRHTLLPGRNVGGGARMDIEKYGFERTDLLVVRADDAVQNLLWILDTLSYPGRRADQGGNSELPTPACGDRSYPGISWKRF